MIISVSSLKGGIGKSTITQNLAVCFAHQGYSVCIADADTNQSCLRWSSYRSEDLPPITVMGYEDGRMLSKNVTQLASKFDIVLIDGTPSLSATASRVIYLADLLIIPILAGVMDIWATEKFIERYENAVDEKGQAIPAYFLLNQFDNRLTISNEIAEAIKGIEDIKTFKSTIGYRVAYKEATVKGMGVYEYSNKKAKKEIVKLTKEIVKIIAE